MNAFDSTSINIHPEHLRVLRGPLNEV